jgi:hypothetical protein
MRVINRSPNNFYTAATNNFAVWATAWYCMKSPYSFLPLVL